MTDVQTKIKTFTPWTSFPARSIDDYHDHAGSVSELADFYL